MNMRMTAFAALTLVAALAVGGCGGKSKYTHPSKGPDQEDADRAECDWEASKATGNVANGSDRSDRIGELIDKCMKAKGYRPR